MGWGTSFGSDPLHALTLCLTYCYVTPGVTPFAQTHPTAVTEQHWSVRKQKTGVEE